MTSIKLLIGMTGSIGIINMPMYLFLIKQEFPDLQIIMTHTAQRFVSQETMALFANRIHTDPFLSSRDGNNHIQLAHWADVIVVIPATSHTIAQVAHGFTGNFLTTIIQAHEKPVLFFPNMNPSMWNNQAVQRNVIQIQQDGHLVIVCEETTGLEYSATKPSLGSIPPPNEIISMIKNVAEQRRNITVKR